VYPTRYHGGHTTLRYIAQSMLPGWTKLNIPLAEESVPTPLFCALHRDNTLGSEP